MGSCIWEGVFLLVKLSSGKAGRGRKSQGNSIKQCLQISMSSLVPMARGPGHGRVTGASSQVEKSITGKILDKGRSWEGCVYCLL